MNRSARMPALLLVLCALAGSGAASAQVDFTRYVAIGDSLTAGFSYGGLVREIQVNSYPALIFRQGSGTAAGFEQPLVGQPGLPPLLTLRSLAPLVIAPKAAQAGPPLNLNLPRPYNNLAVPGADSRDVVATVSGGLHDLVLRGQGTQLQQAVFLSPTFAVVWVGNNDVLGAALAGVVIDDVTLTTTARFDADFRLLIGALAARGVRMAIANLPDVTSIPYVTTIPPVVVNPATQQPVLVGGNPVPLIGPNGLLTPNDFVLLPAAAELAKGIGIPALIPGGSGQPLPDNLVLSASEVATIRGRTAALNGIIQSAANQANAALVDINGEFSDIVANGVHIGGVELTTAFLTGGFFSYDGVHPTPFGYAFLANRFIAAINDRFGSDIEPVNLFPFLFGPEASAGIITAPATAQLAAEAVRDLFWSLEVKTKSPSQEPPAGKKKPRGKRGGRR